MNFEEKAEKAFARRSMPDHLIGSATARTSDESDAFWFFGRDWREITWSDWVAHYGALFQFTHHALAYYLPSVLVLSVKSPEKWLVAADAVINTLASGAALDDWDESRKSSYVGFRNVEYQLMKEWLGILREVGTYSNVSDADRINRALGTIDLLKVKTDHLGSTSHT